jgi:hypothetical protein
MTDEATKAAINAERAAIKVEMIKAAGNEEPPKDNAVIDTKAEETETKEETTETEETENDETTETVEATEDSDEVKALKAQLEKERAKFQKRIDKKTAEGKEAAAKLAEAEKIIAAKSAEDGDRLTKEEAEKLADQKAEAKVAEREFVNACNRLADSAKKLDSKFDDKIKQLSEDVAPLPGYMIGILDDLDNGGAVLKYFTENADEYEDIIALTPPKMAVKLAKLSTKIEADNKPKPKAKSNIPDPITPVGGKGGTNNAILTEADTKDMQSFVKKRQAMVEQRRKAGHYGAR